MTRRRLSLAMLSAILLWGVGTTTRMALAQQKGAQPPAELAEFFRPPEKYRNDFGAFRSPLGIALDGEMVDAFLLVRLIRDPGI